MPYIEIAGMVTTHRCLKSASGWWQGALIFDLPGLERFPQRWQMVSMDPLTLRPSIQHNCGCPLSHGYITDGRWKRV